VEKMTDGAASLPPDLIPKERFDPTILAGYFSATGHRLCPANENSHPLILTSTCPGSLPTPEVPLPIRTIFH
jgi:hypothetical protein